MLAIYFLLVGGRTALIMTRAQMDVQVFVNMIAPPYYYLFLWKPLYQTGVVTPSIPTKLSEILRNG